MIRPTRNRIWLPSDSPTFEYTEDALGAWINDPDRRIDLSRFDSNSHLFLFFSCDTDAFKYNPEIETSRLLLEVSCKVIEREKAGIVVDHNGNSIGSWGIDT